MTDKSLEDFLAREMKISTKTKVSDLTVGQLVDLQFAVNKFYLLELIKNPFERGLDFGKKGFGPLINDIRKTIQSQTFAQSKKPSSMTQTPKKRTLKKTKRKI